MLFGFSCSLPRPGCIWQPQSHDVPLAQYSGRTPIFLLPLLSTPTSSRIKVQEDDFVIDKARAFYPQAKSAHQFP